jgi:hypothetical protein
MSQRDAADGCLFSVFLLVAGLVIGWTGATEHAVSPWLGMGLGAVAWLALHSGFAAVVTLLVWWDRRRTPRGANEPVMLLIEGRSASIVWLVFFTSLAAGAVILKWMGVAGA